MNAERLRRRMKRKKKTQAEVAALIGISKTSLSRKLSGRQEFRLSEVVGLCEVLEIEDPIVFFFDLLSQKCDKML